jgi:putative ATP-dependent endonuclease of OLD family
MLLRSARVENFRAVKCAQITFDPTTVLIGENDCGRSSIIEAVALALGWNSKECEFLFQPFHIHRGMEEERPVAVPISIALEFVEGRRGEWDGQGFEFLRSAWPDIIHRDRRFWLEVTHVPTGGTRWVFRSAGSAPLIDDCRMLAWLRGRMPVFWISEGMMGKGVDVNSTELADPKAKHLADQVSRHYQELLQGTALDISAAIEGGSTAARQLLLAQAKLLPHYATPLGEILEGFAETRKARRSTSSMPLETLGTAAHKIGLLLLVGALLRSGAARVQRGMDPLTLIENPEAHLHPMTLASIWGVIERIRGQKIIATHSGTLLASARLSSVRRLTRRDGLVKEWRVPDGALNGDELRRYSYHLRSRRAAASFARCWLLVEGETEFWLMGEMARVCGYDFASEGVTCVEFAQCGLASLIKVARHLGIEWHLLSDGDPAGQQYARSARQRVGAGIVQDHITLLEDVDLEHCFWRYGYQDVFRKAASPRNVSADASVQRRAPAKAVIARAIERHSKPYLAVLLLDAVIDRGPDGIPPPLKRAIETCVRLARRGPAITQAAATGQ